MLMNPRSSVAGKPMTDDEVRLRAPSAFALAPHSRMSDRYAYIPTSDVIAGLRDEGFVPTFATQSRTRDASRKEHTKHMIRFRRADDAGVAPELGVLFSEICLVNSHDGSSAYQLYSGVFRLLCTNGLMSGESTEAIRIHHKGDIVRDVIDASFTVVEDSKRAIAASQTMGQVNLNRDEQQILAEAAHTLRFDGGELGTVIQAEQLLRPRRAGDTRSDLFTTLNVLQENVIRGGLTGYTSGTDENGRRRRPRRVRTRSVEGIDQNTALNRALFTLAERMAALKSA